MYKISEIISMPIISIYDSSQVGIISNVFFDTKYKRCKYLSVLDDKEDIQKTLNYSDIQSIGNDCLFIKNKTFLELQHNLDKNYNKCTTLINIKCYTIHGEYLGTSQDIILDEKLRVNTIILDNNQIIESKNICNIGDVILTSQDDNKITISKYKPRTKIDKKVEDDKPIKILTEDKHNIVENSNTKDSHIDRIITDYRFLIGRTLEQDIITPNGEIIAKKGVPITKNIVNLASIHGKLVEVARYSK